MLLNHRRVYQADVGLFLILALPGINKYVLELLLSLGGLPRSPDPLLYSLCGVAGVVGLGFCLVRLHLPDSRRIVQISLLVKLLAAAWLFYAFMQDVSEAFLILAIIDFFAALILLIRLIGPRLPREHCGGR